MSIEKTPIARRHHLRYAACAKVEDPMNHLALCGLDLALVLAESEQRLEFRFRDADSGRAEHSRAE